MTDGWSRRPSPSGVTLMEEASVVGFREDPHFIQVKIKQNGKVQYANARYLVGADGAASMVRRHKNSHIRWCPECLENM
ncbi:MAG: FAD-dependent monooxygenase [Clostridia bacterium]